MAAVDCEFLLKAEPIVDLHLLQEAGGFYAWNDNTELAIQVIRGLAFEVIGHIFHGCGRSLRLDQLCPVALAPQFLHIFSAVGGAGMNEPVRRQP